MKIYIGYVGSGTYFFEEIIKYLKEDHCVININEFAVDAIIGSEVAKQVLNDSGSFGIVICGNGFGIAKDAMIDERITVIPCISTSQARSGREINNANVLALGHRMTTVEVAKDIIDTFLKTKTP